MSAFIVDHNVINRIITSIANETDRNRGRTYRQGILAEAGYDAQNYESVKQLGRDLHAMNVVAVRARYPDDTLDDLPGSGMFYEPRFVATLGGLRSRCQYLMDLHCLRYQCSEGTVPDWPLYKTLAEITYSVADSIATSLPEYEQARWDAA